VVGKTTPGEVIAKLGPPTQRTTSVTALPTARTATESGVFAAVQASGTYESFTYFAGDAMRVNADAIMADLLRHGLRRTRTFSCTFYEGKLVAYLGSSSFDPDRTDFDDAKVASLEREKTTGDEVLKLFGEPSGGAIYPVVSRHDGGVLSYFYQEDNIASGRHVKLLQVFVDDSGIVRDFRSVNSSLPSTYVPGPAAPMPIFVPSGRK
jgi:hypothetical protein